MKTIECICNNCNKSFTKPLKEHTRSQKVGRSSFCSLACASKFNPNRFGGKVGNRIPPRNPTNPFKYYLRNIMRRHHKWDVTLEYLKQIWDEQEGICPYTKIKLVLNTHSHRNTDIRFTASLDRINSSIGYIKGNVQFVSMAINYMKSSMSHSDTTEFLQIITKNLNPLLS
jgi:hypothetical protein